MLEAVFGVGGDEGEDGVLLGFVIWGSVIFVALAA